MRLGEAAKLALLSFDSTLRSNLSVGLPIDLLIYERDIDVLLKRIEPTQPSASCPRPGPTRSARPRRIEEFKL
jgi:hypothetical protein